jgi:hypothetical protein
MARSKHTPKKVKATRKEQKVKRNRKGEIVKVNVTKAKKQNPKSVSADKCAIELIGERLLQLLGSSATISLGDGKDFILMDRLAGLYETTFGFPLGSL